MSTIGIVQIHDSINRSKGLYCCICFRTASEAKLVKPLHLKNLISRLVIRFRGALQVCYICEALAQSASRFVRNLELAARVSDLFADMGGVQWQNILQCVAAPHKYPKKLKNHGICQRALDLEGALRKAPRSELRRTDTLVVPSPPQRQEMVVVTMEKGDTPISTAMPLTPLVMAPMAPALAHMAPALAPMAPAFAPMPSALDAKTKISVDPEMRHVRVVNKETKQIVLHPMVQGLDGNVYVPSLQLQILDNGTLKSAPNIDNATCHTFPLPDNGPAEDPLKIHNVSPPRITPPKKTCTTQRHTTIIQENKQTYKSKEKAGYYNFLVSQMEGKQNSNVEIIMNDLNIVLNDGEGKKKRKRSEGSLNEVELLLSANARGECEIKYEIIDDDVAKNKVESLSRPVLNTERTVDWEDKIPMDVISFMDATDPHPEERIMQPPPMGFISDVRSVPKHVAEPIECIDLC